MHTVQAATARIDQSHGAHVFNAQATVIGFGRLVTIAHVDPAYCRCRPRTDCQMAQGRDIFPYGNLNHVFTHAVAGTLSLKIGWNEILGYKFKT